MPSARRSLSSRCPLANVASCSALAPPKPYPPYKAREKLAYQVLAPIALVFAVVPAKVWSMAASFGFGIAFFGQPLLIRAFELLQEKVPDWQEKIDLRKCVESLARPPCRPSR